MNQKVNFISSTPDAEKQIAYCARVSNPKNQDNEKFQNLIKYCIKNQHWSIFEHAFMTLEINTPIWTNRSFFVVKSVIVLRSVV